MTNIIDIRHRFAAPLCKGMITDELIDTLYDFAPIQTRYWSLMIAKAKFNERLSSGNQEWVDFVQVYVGVPDYTVSLDQLKDENLPHLKLSLGLLKAVLADGNVDFKIAIVRRQEHQEKGLAFDAFVHTNTLFFLQMANEIDSENISESDAFASCEEDPVQILENACDHVHGLTQIVTDRLFFVDQYRMKQALLRTAIATCMALADGNKQVIEDFLDLDDVGEIGPVEARHIYSNMDIEEFHDWASGNFNLDDYFESPEDLVFDLKWEMAEDETLLDHDVHYSFLAGIVARSDVMIETA